MAKRTESPSFMPHTRYRQSAEPAILAFPVFSFLTHEQVFLNYPPACPVFFRVFLV